MIIELNGRDKKKFISTCFGLRSCIGIASQYWYFLQNICKGFIKGEFKILQIVSDYFNIRKYYFLIFLPSLSY